MKKGGGFVVKELESELELEGAGSPSAGRLDVCLLPWFPIVDRSLQWQTLLHFVCHLEFRWKSRLPGNDSIQGQEGDRGIVHSSI